MYSDPRSIFQKKIQNILKSEDKHVSEVFEKIFLLQQALSMEKACSQDRDNYKHLLELYSIIGLEKFILMVNSLKGKTISIPSDMDLKESILTVLCFYYKGIENKSWDEIRDIVGLEKNDSIKYGIKARHLDQFIALQLNGEKDGE